MYFVKSEESAHAAALHPRLALSAVRILFVAITATLTLNAHGGGSPFALFLAFGLSLVPFVTALLALAPPQRLGARLGLLFDLLVLMALVAAEAEFGTGAALAFAFTIGRAAAGVPRRLLPAALAGVLLTLAVLLALSAPVAQLGSAVVTMAGIALVVALLPLALSSRAKAPEANGVGEIAGDFGIAIVWRQVGSAAWRLSGSSGEPLGQGLPTDAPAPYRLEGGNARFSPALAQRLGVLAAPAVDFERGNLVGIVIDRTGILGGGGAGELLLDLLVRQIEAASRTEQALATARQDERRSIARMLHDGVLQDLAALGLQIERTIRRLPDAEQRPLATLAELVREQQAGIRAHMQQMLEEAPPADRAAPPAKVGSSS